MRIADEYDAIVLGAGAAGMTAAAVAATGGLRVLLIEKSAQVGGTTAISGGMVWIPANAKMAEAGIADTAEQARLYLRHCVPGGFNEHLRSAFLASADAAIAYLERNTSVRLKPVVNYPDITPICPERRGEDACSSRLRSTGECSESIFGCFGRRCRSSCCSAA